jgi:hypothetical protein
LVVSVAVSTQQFFSQPVILSPGFGRRISRETPAFHTVSASSTSNLLPWLFRLASRLNSFHNQIDDSGPKSQSEIISSSSFSEDPSPKTGAQDDNHKARFALIKNRPSSTISFSGHLKPVPSTCTPARRP